jgi:hypothetical protein
VPERNTAFMTNLPPEKVTVIDGRESMGARGQCQLCESARVRPPRAAKWFLTPFFLSFNYRGKS